MEEWKAGDIAIVHAPDEYRLSHLHEKQVILQCPRDYFGRSWFFKYDGGDFWISSKHLRRPTTPINLPTLAETQARLAEKVRKIRENNPKVEPMKPTLIAGERIEPGDWLYLGDDRKVYVMECSKRRRA